MWDAAEAKAAHLECHKALEDAGLKMRMTGMERAEDEDGPALHITDGQAALSGVPSTEDIKKARPAFAALAQRLGLGAPVERHDSSLNGLIAKAPSPP